MSGVKWRPASGKPRNRASLIKFVEQTRTDLDELGGTLLPKLGESLSADIKKAREQVYDLVDAETNRLGLQITHLEQWRDSSLWGRLRWLLTRKL